MKIQYCSDLHLEFPENKAFLEDKPIKAIGDVLILAGDIIPLRYMDKEKYSGFFDYLSDNFEAVYWVPGNHEYYHSDIAGIQSELNEQIRSNVSIINNVSVNYGKVRILFSTLWTKIGSNNSWAIEQGLSDFRAITFNGDSFTADHYNKLHRQSIRFLEEELNRDDQVRTIVATHHVPTFYSYPEKYRGDVLNEAFAVELYDLIERSYIDYWIFGHHHQNSPDFMIGDTRMVTNQLGYVRYDEHLGFLNNKTIEL